MAFDYKKAYREFYLPKDRPALVTIPAMQYMAVRGQGDPNLPEGEYQRALQMLYATAYTLKMSGRAGRRIDGFFEYLVPPLEGFWQQARGGDTADKAAFRWISVIRLPEFVTEETLRWAKQTAAEKKKIDCAAVELLTVSEGLCVQCLHIGPFDRETETVAEMDRFLTENGYVNDMSETRLHHEIYLSDVRKTPPEKWKTVIRHPIRRG